MQFTYQQIFFKNTGVGKSRDNDEREGEDWERC
jgi:hypothetical protein